MFKLIRKLLNLISLGATLLSLGLIFNMTGNNNKLSLGNIITIEKITPTPTAQDTNNQTSSTAVSAEQLLNQDKKCQNLQIRFKTSLPVVFDVTCIKDSNQEIQILSQSNTIAKYKGILLVWPNSSQLPLSVKFRQTTDIILLNKNFEITDLIPASKCNKICQTYSPKTAYYFILLLPQNTITDFNISKTTKLEILTTKD